MKPIYNHKRSYPTNFHYDRLKQYLILLHISHKRFAEKYCHISSDVLAKVLRGDSTTTATLDSIICGLDQLDKSKKHTFDDICEYINK